MGASRSEVLRHGGGFLAGFTVTYLMASVSQSLIIMAALERIGAKFDLPTRLQVIGHDLVGLAFYSVVKMSYALCLLVGLALALSVAYVLINRCARLPRTLMFTLAGAAAVALILWVIQVKFYYNMTLLEGTRGALGYALQLFAGAAGGFTYAACTRVWSSTPPPFTARSRES